MNEYADRAMSNRILYQVTLASGRIITSPDAFGNGDVDVTDEDYFRPRLAEDGRVLTVAAEAERRAAADHSDAA